MAVEISIISGARRGEKFYYDQKEISIGDSSECLLCFDAEKDPGVAGRRALLLLDESGWRISSTSDTDWLVNQSILSRRSSVTLRSGDVIRFSPSGPDLRFTICAERIAKTPSKAPQPVAAVGAPSSWPIESDPAQSVVRQSVETRRKWIALGAVSAVIVLIALGGFAMFLMPRNDTADAEIILLARDDEATTSADSRVRIDVLKNDEISAGGPPAPRLKITKLHTETTMGLVSIDNSENIVIYDPGGLYSDLKTGERQTDQFAYTIDAGTGATDRATVVVAVHGVQEQRDPPTTEAIPPQENLWAPIVWIGAEIDGYRFPRVVGWVVDPTTVVTIARDVHEMQGYHKNGKHVFVYCDAMEPKVVSVTGFAVHPLYSAENKTSPKSLLHNIGVLRVERPLPQQLDYAERHELTQPLVGSDVRLLGFSIPPNPAPLNELTRSPSQVELKGKVTGTLPYAKLEKSLPLLLLDFANRDDLDGSPILDADGRVIGLYVQYGSPKVILADNLRALHEH